jgi:sortase A
MTMTVAPPEPDAEQPATPSRRRRWPSLRSRSTSTMPPWARSVVTGLCIVAALAGWLALFIGPLSGLRESHQQSTLYARFRDQLSSGVTPPPPFAPGSTVRRGDPVAVLSIPAIGMSRTVVVAGTRSGDLESGPGLLPGTVLPGETGVSTLLGRAFSYGGPFSRIASLKAGDAITATTGQGTYHFTVADSRGPGQPIPGSLAGATSRLTLVTAANSGWRNLWVPSHAIYVDAVLHGTASGDAAGVIPVPADSPMQADTGSLIVLVLWLQLLLAASLLVVWAAVSWGRRQAWTLGVPVIIGVLWGASLEVTKLLPNLL